MSNTAITEVGLNYVTSAHSQGIFMGIKYFVPVYDYRIDPTLRNDLQSVSAISAVVEETQAPGITEPFGESIYNYGTSAYKLSDSTTLEYVLSGFGETSSTTSVITGSKQTNGPVAVNLSASTDLPLGSYYRGDSVELTNTAAGTWTFSPEWSAVNGVNPSVVASDRTKLFPVIDYHPVREDGETVLKGNFTCRIAQNAGTFKFNKIALYAVQYDNGVETSGAPGFFGEAYITSPIERTDLGDGYSEVSIDVQIQLSAGGAGTWESVFYGSSADYWAKVPRGLHSSEKISIGTFQAANDEPLATIQAGQPISAGSGTIYERIPQLRLDYPHTTPANRKNATLEINSDGNILLSATENDVNLLPVVTDARFGNLTYPWKRIVLSGGGETSAATVKDAVDDMIIKTNEQIVDYGEYLKMYRHMIQVYDSDTGEHGMTATQANTLYGYDLVRNYNDLVVQARKENIYVLAGAQNNAAPGNDQSLRHNFSRNDVQAYEYDGTSALASTDNWLWNECYIVARNGIKHYGFTETNFVPRQYGNGFEDYTIESGVYSTRRKYLTTVAGFQKRDSDSDLYHSYENFLYSVAFKQDNDDTDTASNYDPFGDGYINTGSRLFLAAGRIITFGHVKPGYDEYWELGLAGKKWKDIATLAIAADSTNFASSTDNVESNIYGAWFHQQWVANVGTYNQLRRTFLRPPIDSEGRSDVDSEELWIGLETDRITRLYANIANIEELTVNSSFVSTAGLTAPEIISSGIVRAGGGVQSYTRYFNDGVTPIIDGTWYEDNVGTHTQWVTYTNDGAKINVFEWHNTKWMVVGKAIWFRWAFLLINDGSNLTGDKKISEIDLDSLLPGSITLEDDNPGAGLGGNRVVAPYGMTNPGGDIFAKGINILFKGPKTGRARGYFEVRHWNVRIGNSYPDWDSGREAAFYVDINGSIA